MSLEAALGGMRNIPQFFIWRLEWDAEEGKYQKTPCAPDGSVYRMDASKSENWMTFGAAVNALALLPRAQEVTFALGFWLTASTGYFFLDMDKCANGGVLNATASAFVAAFPGACMEFSASGNGVHIFGRTMAPIAPHRSKPPRAIAAALKPMELEFYTADRGVCFGLSGVAQGDADTCHDVRIAELIAAYFPARAEADVDPWEGPRPDWKGPGDDEELIRRALSARKSAESVFAGKASFAQLWYGEAEKNNEHDMALASHLAFWTGCDEKRIERLMLKSGMVREKWHTRRRDMTYLTFTIHNACIGCREVYKEPARDMAVSHEMYGPAPLPPSGPSLVHTVHSAGNVISAEMAARVEELLDEVSKCGTVVDMHNIVIPLIQATKVPGVFVDTLANAINAKLQFMGGKLPMAKLRALVSPPVMDYALDPANIPGWVAHHCYVKDGDYFMDLRNGSLMTYQGFVAEYAREMPVKANGTRENPAEWCLTRWKMPTVHKTGYRPDQGQFFSWEGLDYANTYNEASLPQVTAYTPEGVAGIAALQQLLFDFCGRRQEVFMQLLQWCAHNVQRPGVKIRWSPILKGTHGDGKSLLSNVLRAAMGSRNVGVTGNSTLTNSGGFNQWAIGNALNVIEEIWLVGKERHKLYNATKEFITNDVIDINAKGKSNFRTFNVTNHIAFSNHNDALPLEQEDRRWLVIFAAWASLQEMMDYCGLDPEGWAARTRAVDHAWRYCAGELRAWFLSVDLSGFNKDGSALMTPEKRRMMVSSADDAETVASQIIGEGAHGICGRVLSSACLSHALKIRAMSDGFDVPRNQGLNYLLTRLGFSKVEKPLKWRNGTHTIWIKNGISEDSSTLREILDSTSLQKVGT